MILIFMAIIGSIVKFIANEVLEKHVQSVGKGINKVKQ